jgi:hypothetical protein
LCRELSLTPRSTAIRTSACFHRYAELRSWSEDIVLLARMIAGDHQATGVSKDPDDDIYIAAALEGRCS